VYIIFNCPIVDIDGRLGSRLQGLLWAQAQAKHRELNYGKNGDVGHRTVLRTEGVQRFQAAPLPTVYWRAWLTKPGGHPQHGFGFRVDGGMSGATVPAGNSASVCDSVPPKVGVGDNSTVSYSGASQTQVTQPAYCYTSRNNTPIKSLIKPATMSRLISAHSTHTPLFVFFSQPADPSQSSTQSPLQIQKPPCPLNPAQSQP
jgi:hypothetical protein